MTTFIGTSGGDVANSDATLVLSGFTGGTLAQLTDGIGDLFLSVSGNDDIFAGNGNDSIYGGSGNDDIAGGLGYDLMYGGFGIDTFHIWNVFGDYVFNMTTGVTNFSPQGEFAYDFENVVTQQGNDNITGTAGANRIQTNFGNDVINAGAGNDTLLGGYGNDTLTGGSGSDTFVFDNPLTANSNVDFITDFNRRADTFQLKNNYFATLVLGALPQSAFRVGANAVDSSDRIIYNAGSGDLYFDQDGSGSGLKVRFAHVTPGTSIDFSDFLIV